MTRFRPLYVIVSGAAGSGKTTLARPLAAALSLPLLGKDMIKEALGDTLGAPTLEDSRRLGALAMPVLRALMRDIGFGVYESPWHREYDLDELSRLAAPVVEVFCDCPPEVRAIRIHARQANRHPVHHDLGHLEAIAAALDGDDPTARPLRGLWPVLRVDTSARVDAGRLAERVRRAARGARRGSGTPRRRRPPWR